MSAQPRIVVLCGGRFALPAIRQLALEKYLCGIGIGKGERSMISVMEQESEDRGLSFRSFRDRKSMGRELCSWLEQLKPDAVFSVCFPFCLPGAVLALPGIRFINFHTGPLPAYRGPMPLFEVLRRQEKETALSVHFMTPELDEGPLILQEPLQIRAGATFGSLAAEMSLRTAHAALNMAQMLEYGSHIPSVAQDEANGRYYDQPDLSETYIHWKRMTAGEIEALVRACNPWNNGADTLLQGRHYKIIDAEAMPRAHREAPGTVTALDEAGNIYIACKDDKQLLVRIMSSDEGIFPVSRISGPHWLKAVFE